MTPPEQKQALRDQMRENRRHIPLETRVAAALALSRNLHALPVFNSAESPVTAIYLAKPDELSLDAFIRKVLNRFSVAAPVYQKEGNPHFAELHSLQHLPVAALGLRMLPAEAPKIPDNSIDVILLPGLAFNKEGARLGYGGGWYDKVVPNLRPDVLKIGICFDCQLATDIPQEPHDIRVDLIVTETQTIHALHPNR